MEEYHTESRTKPPNHPIFSQIPEELRQRPQWMGTRFKRLPDGRINKPPYRVRAGENVVKADKTDPKNHATFEEAMLALERSDVDAIGYVFSGDDPFFCVDLDKVINTETGEIGPGAAEIIHTMGGYTELSCSRRGIHIIGVGTKPKWANCRTQELGFEVEVYDQKRFLVLTGEQLAGAGQIRECQGELEELCKRLWPEHTARRPKPPNTGPVDLEDAVLLERARTARSGPKFARLYDQGDTSGHKSHSHADYSLLNMLIFWTAGDRERIIALFEASALYRSKSQGKHRGYAALSTDNALASYRGAFYRPRSPKKLRDEEEGDPLTPYLKLLLDPSQWTGRKGASAYKTYAGAVALAAEHGIFDDEGNVRIGCDTRRLAEAAGTRQATVCESGLPSLVKMGLLRWKRGKGTKASVFSLPPPPQGRTDRIIKVSTHFIDTTYAPPKNALETLRLLVRMRTGHSKHIHVLRLGMPAMFTTVALAAQHPRGQSLAELAEGTGRRKRDLRDVLKKLKGAGIARETSEDTYRLTDEYAANYERHLELSGITYSERAQQRAHKEDRRRRDARLRTDKRPSRLRGKEQLTRLLKKRQEEAKHKSAKQEGEHEKPSESQQERIDRRIREGMSPKWARRSVLAPDHDFRCACQVCL